MSFGIVLLIALGGALALEGAVWAIFPNQMRRAYRDAIEMMDDKALHIGGLVSVAVGVGLISLAMKLAG
jgi:uncharacterized protein YjeT (DUF2065 family)